MLLGDSGARGVRAAAHGGRGVRGSRERDGFHGDGAADGRHGRRVQGDDTHAHTHTHTHTHCSLTQTHSHRHTQADPLTTHSR